MPGIIFWISRRFYKKLFLFFVILVLLFLSIAYFSKPAIPTTGVLPLAGRTIVLDPGHGGYDPGFGYGGIWEKDVVLEISYHLRDMLRQSGAVVVMTREKDEDLLVLPTGPKKQKDLDNRLRIIQESRGEVVISVHANSIASSRWSGAQTFYYEGQEESKILAGMIQEEIIRVMKNTKREIKTGGELYILKNSPVPACVVEVGFLSNPQERKLLTEPSYQKKIAWSIYLGVIRYLNQ